jgi:hypothetical protein
LTSTKPTTHERICERGRHAECTRCSYVLRLFDLLVDTVHIRFGQSQTLQYLTNYIENGNIDNIK